MIAPAGLLALLAAPPLPAGSLDPAALLAVVQTREPRIDLNRDGGADLIRDYGPFGLRALALDSNFDGRPDYWIERDLARERIISDRNWDGRADHWVTRETGRIQIEVDENGDGEADRAWSEDPAASSATIVNSRYESARDAVCEGGANDATEYTASVEEMVERAVAFTAHSPTEKKGRLGLDFVLANDTAEGANACGSRQATIESALASALKTSFDCLSGQDSPRAEAFLCRLAVQLAEGRIRVTCPSGGGPSQGVESCARATRGSIRIFPPSFEGKCGGLPPILFHELAHTLFVPRVEEHDTLLASVSTTEDLLKSGDTVYACELACFGGRGPFRALTQEEKRRDCFERL